MCNIIILAVAKTRCATVRRRGRPVLILQGPCLLAALVAAVVVPR